MPFGNTPFNPPDNVTITLSNIGELQAYKAKSSSSNIGIGFETLESISSGVNNTAVGYSAMIDTTSGSDNVAVGFSAMFLNTTGGSNVAIGKYALNNNTSGSLNVAVGLYAGFHNTTAQGMVAVGAYALDGYDSTSSSVTNMVAIGYYAGLNYTGSESGNIIIGGNVLGTAGESNVIRIGSGIILGSDTQSTLTGTTAGSVVSSQPFQSGSYKKFIAYASGYENTTTIAQTISFPTNFLNQPVITANDTGMSLSVSTSGLTLPSATGTSSFTGIIIIEGY